MKTPFDKKNPEAILICDKCQARLWSIKVLTQFSHSFLKYDDRSRDWEEGNEACPVCEKPFYSMLKDGNPKYTIISPKNGQKFIL